MWWWAIWVKFKPTRKNRPQGGESFLHEVQAVRLQRVGLSSNEPPVHFLATGLC